jgi:MFS transporter, OFA family, oxalate/formate antiporter
MLRSTIFWLLYACSSASASGLMATAQLGPIAEDWCLSAPTHGRQHARRGTRSAQRPERLCRPFSGGLSDRIGPEGTALAFTLGAISYWLLAAAGYTPLGFVMCAGLIFFARRDFSPFPSTCTDTVWTEICNCPMLDSSIPRGYFDFPRSAGKCDEICNRKLGSHFLVGASTNVIVALLASFAPRPMRGRPVTAGADRRAAPGLESMVAADPSV